MTIKKKTLLGCAAAITCASLLIGGTMAFLTDYDTAANEFTIGKVDIDLEEPDWKPDENKTLTPAQEIHKDPTVTNTGSNDAYVYLEVKVPRRKLVTADVTGKRIDAKDLDLFTFTADKEWTLMDQYIKGTDQVYLYSYNAILKPKAKTTALFKTMTFANVVEGQIDGQTFQVPVRAYAIQAENTGGDGKTVPEKAKQAFTAYLNQNKDQKGSVTEK